MSNENMELLERPPSRKKRNFFGLGNLAEASPPAGEGISVSDDCEAAPTGIKSQLVDLREQLRNTGAHIEKMIQEESGFETLAEERRIRAERMEQERDHAIREEAQARVEITGLKAQVAEEREKNATAEQAMASALQQAAAISAVAEDRLQQFARLEQERDRAIREEAQARVEITGVRELLDIARGEAATWKEESLSRATSPTPVSATVIGAESPTALNPALGDLAKGRIGEGTSHDFMVCSYGRTATSWLTSLLHKHPDIFCTHGPNTSKAYKPDIFVNQDDYYAIPLTRICEKHREDAAIRKKGASFFGNVHAFSAGRLAGKIQAEGFNQPLRCINMVRHPFTRIESFVKRWQYEFTIEPYRIGFIQDRMNENPSQIAFEERMREKHNVDFTDIANRLFVYSILFQGNDLSDAEVGYPQVRFERLVKDVEYFLWMFNYITDHQLKATPVLDFYRNNGKTNQSTDEEITSLELLESWEDWKVDLIRFWMSTDTKAATLYEQMGYEIRI